MMSDFGQALERYMKDVTDSITKDLSELNSDGFSSRRKPTSASSSKSETSRAGDKQQFQKDSTGDVKQSSTFPALELPAFLKGFNSSTDLVSLERRMQIPFAQATSVLQMESKSTGCQVTIDHAEWINFAQHHARESPIRRIKVVNNQIAPLESLQFEISILPEEYGSSWQQSIGRLRRGDAWQVENVVLPLSITRLRSITETEGASLRFKLTAGERVLHVQTTPISIQPIYQFFYTEGTERFLATYVTPNRDSIKEVIGNLAKHMKSRTSDASLD